MFVDFGEKVDGGLFFCFDEFLVVFDGYLDIEWCVFGDEVCYFYSVFSLSFGGYYFLNKIDFVGVFGIEFIVEKKVIYGIVLVYMVKEMKVGVV